MPYAESLSPFSIALSLLAFAGSVVAAILALNLYSLLRTGRMGASWRILIIASVIFALLQAVRLFETLIPLPEDGLLSSVVELVFILALAYAFFLQRQTFVGEAAPPQIEIEEDEPEAVSAYEKYS